MTSQMQTAGDLQRGGMNFLDPAMSVARISFGTWRGVNAQLVKAAIQERTI